MSSSKLQQDVINRKAWRSWGARHWFRILSDWTDPGEAAAVASVASSVRGEAILDVGVGGGRTVPLLRGMGADYQAIDYMQEMVDICRQNHPGVRVQQMDARDLSAFADNSFGLIVFSFNGIDAVDYAGRQAILREFRRLLRPGGALVFSTHNLDGPSYRETLTRYLQWPKWSNNPLQLAFNVARAMVNFPLAAINYWRNSPMNQAFDGYAVHICAAHKFAIVIVYIKLEHQRRELSALGFETQAVFGNLDDQPLSAGKSLNDVNWFHFVARKG